MCIHIIEKKKKKEICKSYGPYFYKWIKMWHVSKHKNEVLLLEKS